MFGAEIKFRDPSFFGTEAIGEVVACRKVYENIQGKGVTPKFQYRILMQQYTEPMENFLHSMFLEWFDEADLEPSGN